MLRNDRAMATLSLKKKNLRISEKLARLTKKSVNSVNFLDIVQFFFLMVTDAPFKNALDNNLVNVNLVQTEK